MTLGPEEQESNNNSLLFIWAKSHFDSWLLFFTSQPGSFRLWSKRVREHFEIPHCVTPPISGYADRTLPHADTDLIWCPDSLLLFPQTFLLHGNKFINTKAKKHLAEHRARILIKVHCLYPHDLEIEDALHFFLAFSCFAQCSVVSHQDRRKCNQWRKDVVIRPRNLCY